MRQIYRDDQQEIYAHDGHRFSVIDLRVIPARNLEDISAELIQAYEQVMGTAVRYPFEVADVTNGKQLVIGKFGSGEEAIEFIKDYCAQGLHKQRDELEKDIQQ